MEWLSLVLVRELYRVQFISLAPMLGQNDPVLNLRTLTKANDAKVDPLGVRPALLNQYEVDTNFSPNFNGRGDIITVLT